MKDIAEIFDQMDARIFSTSGENGDGREYPATVYRRAANELHYLRGRVKGLEAEIRKLKKR